MAQSETRTIDGLTVDVFSPPSDSRGRVVLVHGAWVGGWIWEEFAPYLAAKGYTCYVPTLRGHYDSRPVENLGRVSMLDFVEDTTSVCREVEADFVIGESAGGLISMKAAEELDLRGLVLMNPAPPFMVPVTPKVLLRQIRYLPDLLFGRPNKPNAADYKALLLNNVEEPEASEFYERIHAESGKALQEMSLGKVKVDANKISSPVLVVIGHLDELLPSKVHQKTARLLGAEVANYPKMSHHTFSEEGWERVADEVIGWLSTKSSGAHPATA